MREGALHTPDLSEPRADLAGGRRRPSLDLRLGTIGGAIHCGLAGAQSTSAPYLGPMSQLTVWYDAGCPLCLSEIAFMRRLDRAGAIHFVDAKVDDVSCPIDRAELLARFHASEDGVLVSGAAAFAAMWRTIPLLRPLGLAARRPWVLALLQRLYVRFLRVRPRLQRLFAREPA